MIQIGLEYEGIILKDENIIRFSSMPTEHQESIKRRYANPHDNYDCLAECRTPPFHSENTISVDSIAYLLFSQVALLTSIYNELGYDIYWGEMEIPKEIHNSIKSDVKFKKQILTINNGKIIEFSNNNEDKFYRGGGIHLNISGFPKTQMLGIILDCYSKLYNNNFNSFYRKNFLFRYKPEFDGIELMSIGFDSTKFNNIIESFVSTKHFWHLFDPIVKILNENK